MTSKAGKNVLTEMFRVSAVTQRHAPYPIAWQIVSVNPTVTNRLCPYLPVCRGIKKLW